MTLSDIDLFWETNPCLRLVLGSAAVPPPIPVPVVPLGVLMVDAPVVNAASVDAHDGNVRTTGKKRARKSWIEKVDEARQTALLAWRRLLAGNEKACPLAKQVNEEDDEKSRHQVLMDHFANEPTGTSRV